MPVRTADIVIIGGGIIGTSLAYHLALRKPPGLKVMLLEKRGLAEGTTGKSVATIDHQQSTPLNIELRQQSRKIYLELASEFPAQIGYKPIGFLHTVTTPGAQKILERDIALQEKMGVPVESLSPAELHEILPLLRVQEILAAGFCPKDGYLDPYGYPCARISHRLQGNQRSSNDSWGISGGCCCEHSRSLGTKTFRTGGTSSTAKARAWRNRGFKTTQAPPLHLSYDLERGDHLLLPGRNWGSGPPGAS